MCCRSKHRFCCFIQHLGRQTLVLYLKHTVVIESCFFFFWDCLISFSSNTFHLTSFKIHFLSSLLSFFPLFFPSFLFFFSCFVFGRTRGIWKFPSQGLNPSCSCGEARSFNPLHYLHGNPSRSSQVLNPLCHSGNSSKFIFWWHFSFFQQISESSPQCHPRFLPFPKSVWSTPRSTGRGLWLILIFSPSNHLLPGTCGVFFLCKMTIFCQLKIRVCLNCCQTWWVRSELVSLSLSLLRKKYVKIKFSEFSPVCWLDYRVPSVTAFFGAEGGPSSLFLAYIEVPERMFLNCKSDHEQ